MHAQLSAQPISMAAGPDPQDPGSGHPKVYAPGRQAQGGIRWSIWGAGAAGIRAGISSVTLARKNRGKPAFAGAGKIGLYDISQHIRPLKNPKFVAPQMKTPPPGMGSGVVL